MLNHRADNFRSIELELDNGLQVGITGNGALLYVTDEYGEDLPPGEYQDLISYYDRFDIHDIPGRIKSIGAIKIAYNNTFDIHEKAGTLKSIGDIQVKYYNTFDIHDPKGKVKSVGKVSVKYYNAFDPDTLEGMIKSIEGNSRRVAVWGPKPY